MTTHADIYATLSRIVSAANDPTIFVPAINLSGFTLPESMQYVSGLYLARLARYHEAVTRGGDEATVGYDELRQAIEVLIAARQGIYQLGATRQFSLMVFAPDESDEVTTSLTLQEFDEYTRTNIYMLIGRAAICSEQSDADLLQFASWLDLQLHSLALFCMSHDIDLAYIIYQIWVSNKDVHAPSLTDKTITDNHESSATTAQ